MGIINTMRRQNAIYWPPAGSNNYGEPTFGSLVELTLVSGVNSRVRWEDKTETFIGPEGTTETSMANVYLPLLPGGSEAQVGGWLWLGDRADLTDEADPSSNAGAQEIRRFEKLPNLKNTEYLRTAVL